MCPNKPETPLKKRTKTEVPITIFAGKPSVYKPAATFQKVS